MSSYLDALLSNSSGLATALATSDAGVTVGLRDAAPPLAGQIPRARLDDPTKIEWVDAPLPEDLYVARYLGNGTAFPAALPTTPGAAGQALRIKADDPDEFEWYTPAAGANPFDPASQPGRDAESEEFASGIPSNCHIYRADTGAYITPGVGLLPNRSSSVASAPVQGPQSSLGVARWDAAWAPHCLSMQLRSDKAAAAGLTVNQYLSKELTTPLQYQGTAGRGFYVETRLLGLENIGFGTSPYYGLAWFKSLVLTKDSGGMPDWNNRLIVNAYADNGPGDAGTHIRLMKVVGGTLTSLSEVSIAHDYADANALQCLGIGVQNKLVEDIGSGFQGRLFITWRFGGSLRRYSEGTLQGDTIGAYKHIMVSAANLTDPNENIDNIVSVDYIRLFRQGEDFSGANPRYW